MTEAPDIPPPETQPAQPGADPRPRFLADLLATVVPTDAAYEEQASQREALKRTFDRQFAAEHGEALKAEMLRRGADAKTYEDKLELVRWANGELRRFGLAFSSAKTGVGTLTASRAVLDGRYQLTGKTKDEDDKSRSLYTKNIDELVNSAEVVEAPARREGLAERVNREAGSPARNQRSR